MVGIGPLVKRKIPAALLASMRQAVHWYGRVPMVGYAGGVAKNLPVANTSTARMCVPAHVILIAVSIFPTDELSICRDIPSSYHLSETNNNGHIFHI
eukprot:scaffold360_cov192-Amphora_coffeaeformis.AAC.3